ncbi:MAG: DAK2 domain-containing protein [Clostridia bacterium]|nr:DAK2 domain-containing protein [Clostridia bacterium]
MKTLDGVLYAHMINSGASKLKTHVKEINDLNVFPIPDGDTGDNMLMTMMGGVHYENETQEFLDEAANRVSKGMLLSARGNSGVILSQFFEGIKKGFSGLDRADAEQMGNAFRQGVAQAYSSVMTPTEGTILTVMREATEYANFYKDSVEDFLNAFIDEAKRSLARTTDLLPILKKAGVVDSGAKGLIYIVEGMLSAVLGENITDFSPIYEENTEPDIDAFGEDSVLEYGYCTELLLRLQNAKTNIQKFDIRVIIDYLQAIGESVVAVKDGSVVKLHVHTKTPQMVLDFCQQYGEFLKVKIENMSLQHNNIIANEQETEQPKEHKKYGVVAVACGEGLKQAFYERGADVIVDGGQSMNPSAEDFLNAFDEVNADVIFVFPNNGNIILTAHQAARLYQKSDVRVIESSNIGKGYVSLAMLDICSNDTDAIVSELEMAMEGVDTVEISHSVRDAVIDGKKIIKGDYIGFVKKELLGVDKNRFEATRQSIDKINPKDRDAFILIYGKDANKAEAEKIEQYIKAQYKGKEVYVINGGQEVYDYILIIE